MKKSYLIYALWVLLVILWNFVYPQAAPIYDVVIAIILSIIVQLLNKFT